VSQEQARNGTALNLRRWIVVAASAAPLIGLLAVWSSWGLSADEQRFLGTWSILNSPGSLEITFDADGSWTRRPTQPPGPPFTGFWHVEDSQLVMVVHGSKWIQPDKPWRYTAVKLFDRQMIENLSDTLRIVSIDADVIRLRGLKNGIEYVRLEE
jgi:hypothetical protein